MRRPPDAWHTVGRNQHSHCVRGEGHTCTPSSMRRSWPLDSCSTAKFAVPLCTAIDACADPAGHGINRRQPHPRLPPVHTARRRQAHRKAGPVERVKPREALQQKRSFGAALGLRAPTRARAVAWSYRDSRVQAWQPSGASAAHRTRTRRRATAVAAARHVGVLIREHEAGEQHEEGDLVLAVAHEHVCGGPGYNTRGAAEVYKVTTARRREHAAAALPSNLVGRRTDAFVVERAEPDS